ncbi:low molecular weight protein arginine phosphatase [Heyndrickxia coagulans]|uniref:low molecular weight protein arginine phosphatase n=1 Tax=Heyndrickxia coagulans TaxID=1398 RepID=UPI0018A73299|nr:low molecular weight protein arginine phosphatase [Heyndrickxia coagulans]MBF8419327.1 low molecular weight protein arginine phosphatase [Heyndrickxia coagulans]
MNILFVCTGNTCRSPMAEAILKAKQLPGIEVESAGLFAPEGEDASVHTYEVLKENGIDFRHHARNLSENLVDWADVILTMTSGHKQAVAARYPHARNKTFTIAEYAGSSGDVPDPYGGSLDAYRETYQQLHALINRLIKNRKMGNQGRV